MADNERIFGVNNDIPRKDFVTKMLIACTIIYEEEKGENIYFSGVFYNLQGIYSS